MKPSRRIAVIVTGGIVRRQTAGAAFLPGVTCFTDQGEIWL